MMCSDLWFSRNLLLSSLLILLCSYTQAFFILNNASSPPFPSRCYAMSWNNASSLFIAGGRNTYSSIFNDVWNSDDGGVTWFQSVGISYNIYAGNAIAYSGSMYLFGGRSATCSDSNVMMVSPLQQPLSWTFSTMDLGVRSYGMTVLWQPPPSTNGVQQILYIGGTICGQGFFNDVWSYSGNQWSSNGTAGFSQRASAGVQVFKGTQRLL